ncbi:MAG: DUF4276 family protein [Candidatus Hatepunaea meridiana]|nr:DUF4276 family protein [Candidatus Hatepunaea meridiana]
MIRLNFVVEGKTEQAFIRDVIAPYLSEYSIFATARCVETGRKKSRIYRGGISKYEKVRRDIIRWISQEQSRNVFFTCMFDLYRLPDTFPGYSDAVKYSNPSQQASIIEDCLCKDIAHPRDRFIPYIQLYEFEALLFSSPKSIVSRFPSQSSIINQIIEINNQFDTPEHINLDNPPSKRLISLIPNYNKAKDGTSITSIIGIDTIRQECPHFNNWIKKLESLK